MRWPWASVQVVGSDGPLQIVDVKSSHTVLRLWTDGAVGNEYFLLENRQQTGFDASLPGPGLLFWHIDDSVPDNTNPSHYKVALLQADGNRDLEQARNRGDAGDPYPGSTENTSCSSMTNPNSRSYTGADTHVSLTNISPSGPVMTANVAVRSPVPAVPAAAAAGAARADAASEWHRRIEARVAALENRLKGL